MEYNRLIDPLLKTFGKATKIRTYSSHHML